MAIILPDEDKLPDGPKRALVVALHELYDLAGQPSARSITRAIFRWPGSELETVSHETVSSTLRGQTVPAWPKVQSIVTVLVHRAVRELKLNDEVERIHELWLAARRPPGPAPKS